MESIDAEFGARLREAITAIPGESVSSFAKRCEIPEATLRGYVKGKFPTADKALLIADRAEVDLIWLLSGRGSRIEAPASEGFLFTPFASKLAGNSRAELVDAPSSDEFSQELVRIPAYADVRPSAGDGSIPTSANATSFVAFNRNWLRELGVNSAFASILIAEGDSMYPTIPNGSPMLVDTSKTEIRHGCIYAFDLDGDLMVKRIERLPDGTIDLISDNKDRYPIRNVSRDRLGQMNVIGRVFSAVRTF